MACVVILSQKTAEYDQPTTNFEMRPHLFRLGVGLLLVDLFEFVLVFV